jgi:hypothetical protein
MHFADHVLTTTSITISTTDVILVVNAATAPYQSPVDPLTGLATLTLVDDLANPTKIETITYSARTGTGPYNLTGITRGSPAYQWLAGSTCFQAPRAADFLSEDNTSKTTPVANDVIQILDSAAKYIPKKATLASLSTLLGGGGTGTGAAGADARSVKLTATTQAFAYNSAGLIPSPATTTLTATVFSTSGVVSYDFYVNNIAVQTGTANTYTYTPPTNSTSLPTQVEVQVREGTNPTIVAKDTMTIFGLKEASSAITISLSNEATSLPTTAAGVVTYTGSGTTIKVWEGTTPLIEDSTVPYANGSFRITTNASGVTLGTVTGGGTNTATYGNVTNLTGDSATIEYTIVVKNSSGVESAFLRTQSLTKAKQGAVGQRGSINVYVAGQTVWSDAVANAAVAAQGGGVVLTMDQCTLYGTGYSETKYWAGAWVPVGQVINGNLLVTGTVGANQLAATQLITNDAQIDNARIKTLHVAGQAITAMESVYLPNSIPGTGIIPTLPTTTTPTTSTTLGSIGAVTTLATLPISIVPSIPGVSSALGGPGGSSKRIISLGFNYSTFDSTPGSILIEVLRDTTVIANYALSVSTSLNTYEYDNSSISRVAGDGSWTTTLSVNVPLDVSSVISFRMYLVTGRTGFSWTYAPSLYGIFITSITGKR